MRVIKSKLCVRFVIKGLVISLFVSSLIFVTTIYLSLPNVAVLRQCLITTMYKVNLCPESDNYVVLSSISPMLINAVIVAEDGAFYAHRGFDWHELKQSLEANLESKKYARGGSTLTQQLAKNVFLNQEKSLWRKLKEAIIARSLEKEFSKDFILEKYLNVVELGPGVFGAKAASRYYFNKHPKELSVIEAAFLAFLLPNPKLYSASYIQKRELTLFGQQMIRVILKRMRARNMLSPSSYEDALDGLRGFQDSDATTLSYEDN